ncbi:MAG: hypothetical protein LBN05_02395 [Oscillospiraceae bacterium]|jgi:hypothetical protein|nr:hypothetical protein [Oscillospiraceae bacterium]
MRKKTPTALRVLGYGALGTVVATAGFFVWFLRNDDQRNQTAVTTHDYAHILRDNVPVNANPRVVNVAMLGAHDAFSNEIDPKSPLDPNSDTPILGNPLLKLLGGGVFARQARAQRSNAYELAQRGVRLFDIRVTWDGTQWANMHSFISGAFEPNLRHLLRFLHENPGEMLLVDLQHVYPAPHTLDDLVTWIGTIREDGQSLWDFVHYDPNAIPLGKLRWRDVVPEGKAGAVVLLKKEQTPGCRYYYDDSVATWHNEPDTQTLLADIAAEYDRLRADPSNRQNGFSLNQAQSTPPLSLKAIAYWSLLKDAETSNLAVLDHPDFDAWLRVMPQIWFNNTDSMVGDFNDRVVARLNAYNQGIAMNN